MNLKSLKIVSLEIYEGMEAIWPTTGITEIIDMSKLVSRFGDKEIFAIGPRRQVICYIYKDVAYATPFTREALAILKEAGFHQECFYVPFDSGEYPVYEAREWESLERRAEETRKIYFSFDCVRWSELHNIKPLSHRVFKKCFEIPPEGMLIRNALFDERVSPMLNQSAPDSRMSEYLGRYSYNKGIVVFVSHDGRTFIAKGYGLVSKLKRAGYRETGMFVPMSNYGQLIDPVLREHWESLPYFD